MTHGSGAYMLAHFPLFSLISLFLLCFHLLAGENRAGRGSAVARPRLPAARHGGRSLAPPRRRPTLLLLSLAAVRRAGGPHALPSGPWPWLPARRLPAARRAESRRQPAGRSGGVAVQIQAAAVEDATSGDGIRPRWRLEHHPHVDASVRCHGERTVRRSRSSDIRSS